MKKIVFISNTSITINSFLKDTINKLKNDNEIIIFTNFNDNQKKLEGVKYIKINFERKIKILKDISCLFSLIKNIFIIKPDLVFTITPKAGFLGIISSFLLKVKARVHIFTGQVWITKSGIIRKILKVSDKIIFRLSTNCLVDSFAQKKFLIENKILDNNCLNKVKVLGEGSICGVNTEKFKPNKIFREKIRKKYNISNDDKVIIFVGRLNKDKGILDLVEAFNLISAKKYSYNIHLFIVGDDEENLVQKIKKKYKSIINKIHFIGFIDNTEEYFAASDIFCLPSYREGFGMSVLEAGSSGLPVIVSDIYGLNDSIKFGVTGLSNKVGDIRMITENIQYLIENPKISSDMGFYGRLRVKEKFEKDKIIDLFYTFISSLALSTSKKNIAIVSSTQLSIEVFLIKQIQKLSNKFNITIYTKYINESLLLKLNHIHNVKLSYINIHRNINILNDISIFLRLFFYFLFNRFDMLFTITPKAGALAQFSGFFVQIKKRIHWYGGQVWFTKHGLKRNFLKFIDKLIYLSCTNCLTECNSQKKFLEDEKIVKKDSLVIIDNGSICGVDVERFKPNLDYRNYIRNKFKISKDTCLLLFVGRLNIEKGIFDLSKAVSEIVDDITFQNIHLMFVGPDEEYIQKDFYLKYKNLKNYVTFVDFTETPEKYMAAADIFCLPSHREGFGMAALEAASTSLPVIYSNIYGLSDAVEKNLTGLAFEVRNIESLKKNLKILINEKNLRLNLGVKGRERVILKFNQKVVTSKFVKYFENLLI